MPRFKAIAEFIDAESGRRLYPGDTIDLSGDRIDQLRKAQVIDKEIDVETGAKAVVSSPQESKPVESVESAESVESTESAEPVKSSRGPGRSKRK